MGLLLTACRFWLVMGCRAPGKHIQYGFQPGHPPGTSARGISAVPGQGEEAHLNWEKGEGVPTWADSEALLPDQGNDGLSLGPDEEEVPRR